MEEDLRPMPRPALAFEGKENILSIIITANKAVTEMVCDCDLNNICILCIFLHYPHYSIHRSGQKTEFTCIRKRGMEKTSIASIQVYSIKSYNSYNAIMNF